MSNNILVLPEFFFMLVFNGSLTDMLLNLI
jgi:hypothetical protein